jgi:hypothetical protein
MLAYNVLVRKPLFHMTSRVQIRKIMHTTFHYVFCQLKKNKYLSTSGIGLVGVLLSPPFLYQVRISID